MMPSDSARIYEPSEMIAYHVGTEPLRLTTAAAVSLRVLDSAPSGSPSAQR